jgi:hypothetical protein
MALGLGGVAWGGDYAGAGCGTAWRPSLSILTNRTESSQRKDDAPGREPAGKTLPLLPMRFPIEFSGKQQFALI